MPQYNEEDSDGKLEAPGPARTVVSKTNLLDKLQGEELQRMASEKLEQKASVIIELDVPPQKVGLRKSAGAGSGGLVPDRVMPEAPEDLAALEQKAAQTNAFLETVLESPPRWLRASRACVAEATGAQLSIIARSPLFKAIRLNRRLK